MDPNEALRTLRRDVANLARWLDDADASSFARIGAIEALASDVATTFQGLDDWLSKGGFVPEAWTRDGRPPAEPVHGLDWADDGQGYSGRCDCGNWARTDVPTFDALLALYEVHLRVSGVPDHRPAQT